MLYTFRSKYVLFWTTKKCAWFSILLLACRSWATSLLCGNGESGWEYNTSFSLFPCLISLTVSFVILYRLWLCTKNRTKQTLLENNRICHSSSTCLNDLLAYLVKYGINLAWNCFGISLICGGIDLANDIKSYWRSLVLERWGHCDRFCPETKYLPGRGWKFLFVRGLNFVAAYIPLLFLFSFVVCTREEKVLHCFPWPHWV